MSGRIVVELNSILLESLISWGKYKFCVISKVWYWKFSRPPLWTLSLLFKWWKNQCILWSRRATARRMDGGHWSIDRGCWGMDGGVWCTFNGTVHFSKGQSKFNNVTCWAKRKISQGFHKASPVYQCHGPEEWSKVLLDETLVCKKNQNTLSHPLDIQYLRGIINTDNYLNYKLWTWTLLYKVACRKKLSFILQWHF